MKKLLTLKTMINRQIFSFLRNVLCFLIDRLYKEWVYMLGNGRSYSERASERGDLYAKQFIENIIHDRSGKYDPYKLDGNAAISYRTASVVLGKAEVTGLNSLHRTNICSLTEIGNRLFINANLGAGLLKYRRQIMLRFGDFERKAVLLVSLINIKVSVDFSVEKETGRNGFLLNFAVNELDSFKLSVSESGYFDWAINVCLSFWTLVLRRIVRNLLENELEQYILNRLPKYQFPVEGTSYRSETKFKNQHDDVRSNEASLSGSFYMKQRHETPTLFSMSPIGKSIVDDGYHSVKHRTAKYFESNSITKTSKCFPDTSKRTTEKNSYLSAQSLGLFRGSLNRNSCNDVSKVKVEEKCDFVSEISRKTRELSRSLNIISEKLDSIQNITNSISKETTLKKCVKVLDDCPLSDRNIAGELNENEIGYVNEIERVNDYEIEFNSSESTDSVTSSPAKDFENEPSFLICKRRGKIQKSKMSDSSLMSLDSDGYQVKRASVFVNENPGQSKLLEEIFSEINERSSKNVEGNAFDMDIKLQARVDNRYPSPTTKLESSQIDENVLEQSSTETGTFNLTRNYDSERRKAQIDYLEKMFNGKKRKERTEDSNKNRSVSAESCNHCQSPEENFLARDFDLKLCCTEMFQNESRVSCRVDEFEKQLKVSVEDPESITSNGIEKSYRNQGVKMPEIQCISNPEEKVDGRNLFKSNIISDSMQQKMVEEEKSFDLEADTEAVSRSLQLSEKHENVVNEKIPFKCFDVHIEKELKDSKPKPYEGYNTDNSSGSEDLIFFRFPAQSLDLYSGSMQKNSCDEVSKAEVEKKSDPFSVYARDALEISKPLKVKMENFGSDNITNLWFQKSSVMEERACSNERVTQSADSMVEFPSITGLKFNANSNKNCSEETQHLKRMHDLQEEIIAKTRKMVPDVLLESDSEDNEYSNSFPVLSYKNLKYHKDKSICNEVNRFKNIKKLGKNSKADLEESSRQKVVGSRLFAMESPILKYKTFRNFVYTLESDSEASTSSETDSEASTSSETDSETSTSSETDSETSTASETDNEPKYDLLKKDLK